MMPKAGGSMSICASRWAAVGFLYGWTLFLVIQTGTIAAVAWPSASSGRLFHGRVDDSLALAYRPRSRAQAWPWCLATWISRQHGQPYRHPDRRLSRRSEHLWRQAGRPDQNVFTTAKALSLAG